MGGGVAFAVSHELWRRKASGSDSTSNRYQGTIFMCSVPPLLHLLLPTPPHLPFPLLFAIFALLVLPLPTSSIATIISSSSYSSPFSSPELPFLLHILAFALLHVPVDNVAIVWCHCDLSLYDCFLVRHLLPSFPPPLSSSISSSSSSFFQHHVVLRVWS